MAKDTLANDIFAALWKAKIIKGADDPWHLPSLQDYRNGIITQIQEVIHASQGPTDPRFKNHPEYEEGPNDTAVEFDGRRVTVRSIKGETGVHAGGDSVGADPGPIPCS